MKIFIFPFLIGILLLASCRKEEPTLFKQSPEERLKIAIDSIHQQLTSSADGWRGIIFPEKSTPVHFLVVFKNDGTANIQGIGISGGTTYAIKSLEAPSLVFENYNPLNLLTETNTDIAGGQPGLGFKSDFEFTILSRTSDTIVLKGNMYNTRAVLTRGKPGDSNTYMPFLVNISDTLNTSGSLLHGPFPQLILNQKPIADIKIKIGWPRNNIYFTYAVKDSTLKTDSTDFYYTGNGLSLILSSPVTINGTVIRGFDQMQYDSGAHVFTFITPDGIKGSITGSNKPSFGWDPADVQRLMNVLPQRLISVGGFQENGRTNILSYDTPLATYRPTAITLTNNGMSLVIPLKDTESGGTVDIYIGQEINPVSNRDGVIYFGASVPPVELIPAIPSSVFPGFAPNFAQLTDAGGYHVAQVENGFILVSITNPDRYIIFSL